MHGVVGDFERNLRGSPRAGGDSSRSLARRSAISRARSARAFSALHGLFGTGEALLLGADLVKDPARLRPHNDPRGVTAEFNCNVLHVINRELGGDFDVERFEHVARWDAENEWIEMLRGSDVDQRVRVDALDLEVEFAAGEEMRTETSDKFRRQGLQAELDSAGFELAHWWEDLDGRLRPLAVVLGGRDAGRRTRRRLRRRGVRRRNEPGLDGDFQPTLVERALVGGECTYWACMPSKTLLRAPELLAAARQAPGAIEAVSGALDVERVFWWRDQVVEGYADEGHGEWLAGRDTALVRGNATVKAPGVLDVGGREVPYDKLVVATGLHPRRLLWTG